MLSVLVLALAIVATSFAAPIDAPFNDLAAHNSSNGTSSFAFSDVIGGLGGIDFAGPSFSDIAALAKQPEALNITIISINGDKRVDQITYDTAFPNGSVGHYAYGGQGGSLVSLKLHDGEFINEVRIQLGTRNSRRQVIRARPDEEQDGFSQGDNGPFNSPESFHGGLSEDGSEPFDLVSLNSGLDKDYSGLFDNAPSSLMQPLQNQNQGAAKLSIINGRYSVSRILITSGAVLGVATVGITAAFVGIHIHNIISGKHGSQRIYYMAIITNLGNKIEQGVLDGSLVTVIKPPYGYTKLVGFLGRSGDEVDAIGPVWA